MKRLYNLLGISTPVIVLSAVMLVVSLASQPARAEQQPDTLLREAVEQLLDELRSNRPKYEADKCQLYSLVNDLVLPQFAIDKTVRLILGKHFKAANPEMRSRFTDAFMEMMIRTYATAMFEYIEQGLVDYVMWRSKDGHWQILDIRIDHVSLVMAYRLQYDPMIRKKGFEALIHRLETKIEDC